MRRLILALTLLSSVAAAQPAKPDPARVNEAKAHYRQGKALVDAGAFDEGVAEYEAGYAIVPLPEFLFNIAQAYRLKGDKAKAIEAFRRYLVAAPDGAGAIEASKHIATLTVELKAEAATLLIVVEPPGAEVAVDDVTVTAVAPGRYQVPLAAGAHRVVAVTADGKASESVTLATGERRELTLRIAAPPTTLAVVTPPGPDPTVISRPAPAAAPGKLGLSLRGDAEPLHSGVAALVAVTYRVAPPVDLVAGAILGPPVGAYVGGRYLIGSGQLRPAVVAGVPILFRDSLGVGAHLGAGVQLDLGARLAVSLEVAGEQFFNLPAEYARTLLLVSLGVQARL
jgi:hypothetical protein